MSGFDGADFSERSGAIVLSAVLDNETAGGFSAGSNDLVFGSGNESDPDGWKQVDNKTFKVPAGKAGRYLIACNVMGEIADALSTFIIEIKVNGATVASSNDDRDNLGGRYNSATALIDLVVGDDVLAVYFLSDAMGTTHVQRLGIQQLAQLALG